MKQTGVAVLFGGVLVLQIVALAVTWGGGSWVFGAAVAVVICGFALRRRYALGAYGVAFVAVVVARVAELPAEPGPAAALGLAVLTGSVVRRQRLRFAAVVVAAGLAVVVVSVLATRPPVSGADPVAAFHGITWCGAVIVGATLRAVAARRRIVAARVRRQERLDLARELHDVAAHHLTGLVLQAQGARLVAGRHPDRLDGALNDIETAGADALTAMRRVVGLLRSDAALAHDDLAALVANFDGPPVTLHLPEGDLPLPDTVYRIVRESLTNIARHAPRARSVTVDVRRDDDGVTVEVTDDGPPAQSSGRGGYGLLGMRERVEALGGTLHAGPAAALAAPVGPESGTPAAGDHPPGAQSHAAAAQDRTADARSRTPGAESGAKSAEDHAAGAGGGTAAGWCVRARLPLREAR